MAATQVVARDRHAEYLYACASIGATCELMAVELRHLQRTEVREVQEGFKPGQKGSSAMPHKRNPISAETISGLARVLRSNLSAGLQDVALWHERDISHSSVERIILPDSSQLAFYVMKRLRRLLDGLVVFPERMQANLDASFGLVFSQPVLLALVQAGATRDDAYRIVQRNAMQAWDEGRDFRTLLEADDDVDDEVLDDAFDLASLTAKSRSRARSGRATSSSDGRAPVVASVGATDAGTLEGAGGNADITPRGVGDRLAVGVALRDADELGLEGVHVDGVRLRGQLGFEVASLLDEQQLVERAGAGEFGIDRVEALLDRLGCALAAPFWLGGAQAFEIITHDPTLHSTFCKRRFVLVAHWSSGATFSNHEFTV